ncbi:MAG TPA: ChbG/HpnK family deacetylase [Clostridiales bacterium]|nr:ChbG/HpnK family deacetylase [Clostridiales bacterium]
MPKYLLVNADDFGMCHSANVATFELFEKGYLKSATIMIPCPTAKEAVDFSVANPEYGIGVHLTMTAEWENYRWKPLTMRKSLMDKEGFMWHEAEEVQLHAKLKDLEAEIRAQIDKAHEWGMRPDHIDSHMTSLYGFNTGRFSVLGMTIRVVGEYGYAYRLYTKTDPRVSPRDIPYPIWAATTKISSRLSKKHGVIMPDYLLFPDWNKDLRENGYEHYRDEILKIWTNIPENEVTETFVHPSIESDEIKGITGLWHCRVWEYELLKDPYVHQYLKDHDVQLVSYGDLIRMKTSY